MTTTLHTPNATDHLDVLESHALFILREVVAECERPVLLFSGGKDSAVLLHLAAKAFAPQQLPFPVLHIDTGQNFEEVLNFRNRAVEAAGARLIVAKVQDTINQGKVADPGPLGSRNRLQTVTLLDATSVLPGHDGLPRPWRRDMLIRAVARAAGRTAEPAVTVPIIAGPERLGGRVLVVDDNSVNRKILARQVELAGASTDAAAGGEEALELWRKGRYDLVLADLQMPSMDGFELARRIRQSEEDEHRGRTPILAVTASALQDQEQKSRAVGMDGLITKPVGIEQLRATLDVWLKNARVEHTT